MKKAVIVAIVLLAGCSSSQIHRMADGRYVATYTDRSLFYTEQSATSKVIAKASEACAPKEASVIEIRSKPTGSGTFARLVYECK